ARGEPDRRFEAARRFDSSALGSLFDRSFGTVYSLLVALLGDAELAEAAATATYARVLEWLGDTHGRRTGLNGWVARTACLEAARRRPAADQSANSAGGSPRDARHLRAILWTLPADPREIVALRVLTDMDIAEMAAAGGRSVRLTLDLLQLGLPHLAGD